MKICLLSILTVILGHAAFANSADRNFKMAISPRESVVVPSGGMQSCFDAYKDLKSGSKAPSFSIRGPAITFSDFALKIDSTENLSIQRLRMIVEGTGIAGGKFISDLNSSELEALLGRSPNNIQGPIVISSSDSNRSSYPPCGLSVGDIVLNSSTRTQSFRVQVTVELRGISVDQKGRRKLINKKIRGYAAYIGDV